MSSSTWAVGAVVAFAGALGAVGCAAPASTMQSSLETMQRESAPDKLAARGDAAAAMGDMTRAEQYFVAALRSRGDQPRLVRRLIAVCVADGRYPVALEYADDYLHQHPADLDVRYVASTLRVATEDDERARADLEQVVEARPRFADAHWVLALIHRRRGQVTAAERELRAYLALAPSGAHAELAHEILTRNAP